MAKNELVAAKNGDKTAFESLLAGYEPLVISEAGRMVAKYPELRDEEDELRQEGRMAFYDAVMGYTENEGVTFGLYAKICIHNRLISYLRKITSAKKKAERMATAQIKSSVSSAADDLMMAYEGRAQFRKFISETLTGYEQKVLMLYMEKKSYREIAQELGKDEKSVDNALCRAKSKIKRLFL